jgi:hypothetical protein
VTSISQRSKFDHANGVVDLMLWLLCDKSMKNKDTLGNVEWTRCLIFFVSSLTDMLGITILTSHAWSKEK